MELVNGDEKENSGARLGSVFDGFYKGHRKACVYAVSAFLPMMIMLVVWFFMGMYPFGNKSLMAVDFGQQYISFTVF